MAFLTMAFVQTACEKDSSSEPGKTGNAWKGIGKSLETPTGAVFHLPEGIELANDIIKGYNRNECACRQEDIACHRGSGKLVSVCLGFTNTTSETITVTIPEGLIVISTSTQTQNGLFIKLETFEIPADSTVYFSVGTYCLNSGRSPAYINDEFTLGPVTENEDILELLGLLRNKRIDTDEASAIVQAALWNITDGKGLTHIDRQLIAALPDK